MRKVKFISFLAFLCVWNCSEVPEHEKCGSNEYAIEKEFCYNNVVYEKCAGEEYEPEKQFCSGNIVYIKCDGSEYDPTNKKCENNILKMKCEEDYYNPATQFCSSDKIYNKCNNAEYAPATHFCLSETIYPKCNDAEYIPATQFCSGNAVYPKCNGTEYNPENRYCSNGELKNYGTLNYGGQTYKTVVIGSQTWMAENLKYNASGSVCDYYYDGNDCSKYGRFYHLNTARNICPNDWHLPKKYEWEELIDYVGSNAGTKLKAVSGWFSEGNGTDDYAFSALPGGYYHYYNDSHVRIHTGTGGFWWDGDDECYSGYGRGWTMQSDSKNLVYGIRPCNWLSSVRCVKD